MTGRLDCRLTAQRDVIPSCTLILCVPDEVPVQTRPADAILLPSPRASNCRHLLLLEADAASASLGKKGIGTQSRPKTVGVVNVIWVVGLFAQAVQVTQVEKPTNSESTENCIPMKDGM